MPVNVSKTAKISSSSQLTLNDLRELVKACDGMPAGARVTVNNGGGGYGGSYTSITVTE